MSVPSLLVPLAVLAVLWVAGLGMADVLARRLPRDARAALAPLCAVAVLFITSPIALAGVPPLVLGVGVLALLTTVTAARWRTVVTVACKATWPIAVASIALAFCAAPAVLHGTWAAATLGNQDPYVWVSQARALIDGPASGAAETTPDRVAYRLLTNENWPTGIPVSLAELAAAERVDPVEAYGIFAAIISSLLAVAVFFCARGCLHWSARYSAIGAGVVGANGLVLLSAFYGWQAQLLLTTVGTLLIFTLPLCLDRRALRRELLLPALFAAAAVAVYGWLVLPFAAIAAAGCCSFWPARVPSVVRRRLAIRLAAVAGLALLLGTVPVVEAVRTVVATHTQASSSVLRSWARYDWAFPSDSLGLVPRDPSNTPGVGWTLFALADAGVLLATAAVRGRSFRNPRGRVLIAANVGALAALAALAVNGSSPYMSLKLMAYCIPLFTLLAVAGLVAQRAPKPGPEHRSNTRRMLATAPSAGLSAAVITAAALFFVSSEYAMRLGLHERLSTSVDSVVAAAQRLPAGSVIRIDVPDPWEQVWLVYFLRDRPLSVRRPSVTLAGYSRRDAATRGTFNAPAAYVIARAVRGSAVWRGAEASIYALPTRPG